MLCVLVHGGLLTSVRACTVCAGQNGGVTIEAGGVAAQSRSTFLPRTSGLGKMVNQNEAYFRGLFRPQSTEDGRYPVYERLSVFGEWCGPGVQKGVRRLVLRLASSSSSSTWHQVSACVSGSRPSWWLAAAAGGAE